MKRYIKCNTTTEWMSSDKLSYLKHGGDYDHLRDIYVLPIILDVLDELHIDTEVSGYSDYADIVYTNYKDGTVATESLHDSYMHEIQLVTSSKSANAFKNKFRAYLQSLDFE